LRNVTVPVGTTLPEAGDTFAVKVTLVPAAGEVDEAVSDVEVATTTVFTTRLTALEIDDASLLSPL
jgi:hypothetical protein